MLSRGLKPARMPRPASVASTQRVEQYLQTRKQILELRENKVRRRRPRKTSRSWSAKISVRSSMSRLLADPDHVLRFRQHRRRLDSELSLLWWEYSKTNWLANPLHYAYAGAASSARSSW